MEISFEKGKFVYCPGGFNYQEVLDDFKRAKKVRIITYNISGTGNTDPLLEQIKKLGEDVDVQIITNIPSRFETYYSSAAGEAMRSRAKHNIEVYLKKLNPESFPTAFSISFNFFNHAKIIGTENIVYIGSANFSNESKQNIETGVIIEDSAFIARLYDEFFEYIKDIRMKLPTELQQSVWIVEERNKILAEAQGEAKLIIQEAQETLQKMIEQHEITKYAEDRAQMILENARKDSREIRIGAIEYANETVKVVEQQLKLTLESIHKEAQNFENYITNELRILYDHRQELKEMIHPQPVMEERE